MQPRYLDCLIQDKTKPTKTRKLAYIEWGSPDAYPIVCVHGLTRNAHDFDYIAPELAVHFRVICLDVMGRGRSEYASEAGFYDYKHYIPDFHDFLKKLQIPECYFVGTSMGGIIGMIFATMFPHVIKKLVLNDIGPYIAKKAIEKIGNYVSLYRNYSNFAAAENYLKTIFSQFGIDSEDKWRHFTTHSIIENPDGSYRLNYDSAISLMFQSHDAYKTDMNLWGVWAMLKKTLPILLLRGELSNILSVATARQMKLTHPLMTEAQIMGVGHAPALMNEEQISLIKEWLLR